MGEYDDATWNEGQTIRHKRRLHFSWKRPNSLIFPLSPYLLTQLRESAKKSPRTETAWVKWRWWGRHHRRHCFTVAQRCYSQCQLKSGGFVSVTITANPFSMPVQHREFVFSMNWYGPGIRGSKKPRGRKMKQLLIKKPAVSWSLEEPLTPGKSVLTVRTFR